MTGRILYSLSTNDVDSVLEDRPNVTDEQRAACYSAVEGMDSSSIFEQIEVLVGITLEE